jgi:hypothetical protein
LFLANRGELEVPGDSLVAGIDRAGDVGGGVAEGGDRADRQSRRYEGDGGEGGGGFFGVGAAAVLGGEAEVVFGAWGEPAEFGVDVSRDRGVAGGGAGDRVFGPAADLGGAGEFFSRWVGGELFVADVFEVAVDVEAGIGAGGSFDLAGDFGGPLGDGGGVVGGEDARFRDRAHGGEGGGRVFGIRAALV